MFLSRFVPVLAAGALVVATVAPVSAAETDEAEGVGSTTGTLSVLGIDAGELLSLEVLGDRGDASNDPALGEPAAAALLSALSLDSLLLPAPIEAPLLQATSTGGEQTDSQDTTSLPANPLLGGQILPAALSALVGDDGASSSIDAGLVDLDVLQGLLGLSSTDLDLGADALTTWADGSQGLTLDGLTVLDLEALLAGLGLPLTDLPVETVLGLLDGLGLSAQLDAVLAELGLNEVLADLGLDLIDLDDLSSGTVTDLVETLPTLLVSGPGLSVGDLCGTVDDTTGGLLGGIGGIGGVGDVVDGVIDLCEDAGAAVDDLVDVEVLAALVTELLGDLLDTALGLVEGATLLSLDGLDVTMLTTATDSLDTSVADVTAVLGELTVGDLDLVAPVAQVSGAITQVEGAIGGILGQIDPMLAGLVDLSLLEEATSVTADDDGAITSAASFTGLGIDLAPVDVDALLAAVTGGGAVSIGDQLAALGLPLPDASPILGLNDQLGSLVGGTDVVTLLSEGVSMQIASMTQQSTYEVLSASAPAPTPAGPSPSPQPTLPKTGSDDAAWLLAAGLAAVGALGLRRIGQRIES